MKEDEGPTRDEANNERQDGKKERRRRKREEEGVLYEGPYPAEARTIECSAKGVGGVGEGRSRGVGGKGVDGRLVGGVHSPPPL